MSDEAEREARAFFVDSRFEQLARRPGGMPRDEALERAQATIDEIRPSFGEWLDDHSGYYGYGLLNVYQSMQERE